MKKLIPLLALVFCLDGKAQCSITITGNTIICNDSTTTLLASGASSYTWMPGGVTTSSITITPSGTTTYTVAGVISTCTATAIVVVNPTPTVSAVASPTTICAGGYFPGGGGTSTLTASGASTFTWSTGANTQNIVVSNLYSSNNSAEIVTYTVVGTNTLGCTSTTTVALTVNPLLMPPTCPSMPGANFTICTDSVLTFSVFPDSGTVCIWSWSCISGGCSSGVGFSPSTNIFTVVSSSSNEEVFINVYDSSTVTGCTSLNNAGAVLIIGVVINDCTGIQQYNLDNKVNVYPNPNNGSFVIEPQNTLYNVHCTVYDVNGKAVLTQTIYGKTTVDAGNLNEGVYNISLLSSEGVVNKRLVIVK